MKISVELESGHVLHGEHTIFPTEVPQDLVQNAVNETRERCATYVNLHAGEDLIVVDRARFDRLLKVAQAAYIETMPGILKAIRQLEPGDFDPIE